MADEQTRREVEPAGGRGKGSWLALGALAFVTVMVVFFPAARVFLAISIPIGIVCAVILYFVHKRPVKVDETANKRPLGL